MAKQRGRPFVTGYDPRRHQLTTEERRRGFAAMMSKPMPQRLRVAIRRKIKASLRGKPNRRTIEAIAAHQRIYEEAIPF